MFAAYQLFAVTEVTPADPLAGGVVVLVKVLGRRVIRRRGGWVWHRLLRFDLGERFAGHQEIGRESFAPSFDPGLGIAGPHEAQACCVVPP